MLEVDNTHRTVQHKHSRDVSQDACVVKKEGKTNQNQHKIQEQLLIIPTLHLARTSALPEKEGGRGKIWPRERGGGGRNGGGRRGLQWG